MKVAHSSLWGGLDSPVIITAISSSCVFSLQAGLEQQLVPVACGLGVVSTEPLLDTTSFLAASLYVCSFFPWEGHREDRIALKEI